jgi:predicted metal-dependent phosphoesterase TrpH
MPFDDQFAYNFVLDVHSHTTFSDGRLTPEQAVKYAIAEGLDGIVVTDHQNILGSEAAQTYAERAYPGQLVVLRGLEYTTCRCHLNLVGVQNDSEILPLIKAWPTDSELEAVINATHAAEGIVILNHIPWSTNIHQNTRNEPRMENHPTRDQFVAMGIDAIEVAGGFVFDLQSAIYARRNGKVGIVGGSDTHNPGAGLYSYTGLNVTDRSREAVMTELRARRSTVLYDAVGSPHAVKPSLNVGYEWYGPYFWFRLLFDGFFYTYDPGMFSFNGGFCDVAIFKVHWAAIISFALLTTCLFFCSEGLRFLYVVACASALYRRCQRRFVNQRSHSKLEATWQCQDHEIAPPKGDDSPAALDNVVCRDSRASTPSARPSRNTLISSAPAGLFADGHRNSLKSDGTQHLARADRKSFSSASPRSPQVETE